MKVSRAIGIDLGTTNSAVAVTNRELTAIVCYEDSVTRQKVIPSVVAYDSNKDEVIVGRRAFNRRGTKPEPIVSITRKMGTQEKVSLGSKELLPEEISAHILQGCKKLMLETLGEKHGDDAYRIDRAVITAPVCFGMNAVEATKRAGELAGLEVLEILQEPSAAALCNPHRPARG